MRQQYIGILTFCMNVRCIFLEFIPLFIRSILLQALLRAVFIIKKVNILDSCRLLWVSLVSRPNTSGRVNIHRWEAPVRTSQDPTRKKPRSHFHCNVLRGTHCCWHYWPSDTDEVRSVAITHCGKTYARSRLHLLLSTHKTGNSPTAPCNGATILVSLKRLTQGISAKA